MSDLANDPAARRAEWHRYYSEKRIGHQWLQVNLLADLAVETVLEIGPYLGLVTALLDNAGYRVTTLDRLARLYENARVPHLLRDLTEVRSDELQGHDVILCCETLEHLPWQEFERYLALFRASRSRYLVLSLPYEGFQIDFRVYLNAFTARRAFVLKKLREGKRFPAERVSDPYGHKWEVGYRGHSIAQLEAKIAAAGWRLHRREFTSPTRSVFYLLENPDMVPRSG